MNTLALNDNWLDSTPTYAASKEVKAVLNNVSYNGLSSGYVPMGQNSNCLGYYYKDYYYPYYIHTTEHKPIKLTMSEIEKLRVLAKKDKEVKAILSKFTNQIEITVDF